MLEKINKVYTDNPLVSNIVIIAILFIFVYLLCGELNTGNNPGADNSSAINRVEQIEEQQRAVAGQVELAGRELQSAREAVGRIDAAVVRGEVASENLEREITKGRNLVDECRSLAEDNARIMREVESSN